MEPAGDTKKSRSSEKGKIKAGSRKGAPVSIEPTRTAKKIKGGSHKGTPVSMEPTGDAKKSEGRRKAGSKAAHTEALRSRWSMPGTLRRAEVPRRASS
jgi:hypothetical protein